jgi:uncharacterized damage-inducible protein DinB
MTNVHAVAHRTQEHAELIESLNRHRYFLRFTCRDLTDEQAATRTTASALTLGGLIKHVTGVERGWIAFAVDGAAGMQRANAELDWPAQFNMQPGETLAGLLQAYDEQARRTDEIIAQVADLNASHPLPSAPWFEPGATWSARRVVLHLIAEISQHAGHADIIRESLDGQKTMG